MGRAFFNAFPICFMTVQSDILFKCLYCRQYVDIYAPCDQQHKYNRAYPILILQTERNHHKFLYSHTQPAPCRVPLKLKAYRLVSDHREKKIIAAM